MPPTKRGRPAATEAPPEPEPVAADDTDNDNDNDNASNRSDQDASLDPSLDTDERESGFKIFNTTFSTFRVSPLYIAKNPFTPVGFETLSRRLRDTLVGDVVRGVQVGLEGDGSGALGRLGVLERVEWRECGLESILPGYAGRRRGAGGREKEGGGRRLLCLELEYENATFSALMLPALDDAKSEGDGDGDGDETMRSRGHPSWTHGQPESRSRSKGKSIDTGKGTEEDEDEENVYAHFPLLLTRMPAPLKAVVVDFLASTFDCRISTLHIGTRTLVRSWERWIEGSGIAEGKKTLRKDLALTLGFHVEPARDGIKVGESEEGANAHDSKRVIEAPMALGLKTIDVIVPAEEVRRFLRVARRPPGDVRKGRGMKRSAYSVEGTEEETEEKERRRRRRLGGGRDEEGWGWRETSSQRHRSTHDDEETIPQPFTDALATYLNHHLALDIFHPGTRVLRVVCDAFALSEGRVKIFQPPHLRLAATTTSSNNTTTTSTSNSKTTGPRKKPRKGGDGTHNNPIGDSGILGEGDGVGVGVVATFLRDLIRRAQGRRWGEAAIRLAAL